MLRETPYWWVAQNIESRLAPRQVPIPEKQHRQELLSYTNNDHRICTYTAFDSGEIQRLRLLEPYCVAVALFLPCQQKSRHYGENSISCGPVPQFFVLFVGIISFSPFCCIALVSDQVFRTIIFPV